MHYKKNGRLACGEFDERRYGATGGKDMADSAAAG
jgi:hypothetical protein